MAFKVGDRVVYPHHGAAVIKKKESRQVEGEKVDYFVLHMAHGDLTLSVPVDKAEEVGMRPPISEEDVCACSPSAMCESRPTGAGASRTTRRS
jgi:CarD family transcriptional regulator